MIVPPILGLVLAGGQSARMGRDKGALIYAGRPQVLRAVELLAKFCESVVVSVRPDQVALDCYRDLVLVEDAGDVAGPAAGLLAAWERQPVAALLVLAVDLPLVDEALLSALVDVRDPTSVATAYLHPNGTPEPLCTIWEPAARDELLRRAQAGNPSLRRVLEASRVEWLRPADPDRLLSVNTPADHERVAARLRHPRID